MEQFEKSLLEMPVYVGKVERAKSRYKDNYYDDGQVNNLFIAFMFGYSFGKTNSTT